MSLIQVLFEGIPEGLQPETKRYVTEIQHVLQMSFNSNWGADLRQKWFGERDTVRMLNMLATMEKYLNGKCSRITFVREEGTHYGAVWPTVMVDNENPDDYKKGDGYLRVPSGLRIYLASSYDNPETNQGGDDSSLYSQSLGRVNTIFHEMTHKILRTDDVVFPGTNFECYGIPMCKKLRTIHPDLALNNADNWGFYMANCFKHVFG